jgi:hypothetical protein
MIMCIIPSFVLISISVDYSWSLICNDDQYIWIRYMLRLINLLISLLGLLITWHKATDIFITKYGSKISVGRYGKLDRCLRISGYDEELSDEELFKVIRSDAYHKFAGKSENKELSDKLENVTNDDIAKITIDIVDRYKKHIEPSWCPR